MAVVVPSASEMFVRILTDPENRALYDAAKPTRIPELDLAPPARDQEPSGTPCRAKKKTQRRASGAKSEVVRIPVGAVVVPVGPSVNGMYLNVPGRGRILSKAYREWKEKAVPLLAAMPKPTVFPVEVCFVILPGKGWRRNADVGNREKPVTDALVSAGVLEDDCQEFVAGVRGAVSPGRLEGPPMVAVWCEVWKQWWEVGCEA